MSKVKTDLGKHSALFYFEDMECWHVSGRMKNPKNSFCWLFCKSTGKRSDSHRLWAIANLPLPETRAEPWHVLFQYSHSGSPFFKVYTFFLKIGTGLYSKRKVGKRLLIPNVTVNCGCLSSFKYASI